MRWGPRGGRGALPLAPRYARMTFYHSRWCTFILRVFRYFLRVSECNQQDLDRLYGKQFDNLSIEKKWALTKHNLRSSGYDKHPRLFCCKNHADRVLQ